MSYRDELAAAPARIEAREHHRHGGSETGSSRASVTCPMCRSIAGATVEMQHNNQMGMNVRGGGGSTVSCPACGYAATKRDKALVALVYPRRVKHLALALALLAGCSKKAEEPASGSAGSAGSGVVPAKTGRPKSIDQSMIDALEQLDAEYKKVGPDLTSPDCAREAAALVALTPGTKKLADIAIKLDEVSTTDEAARLWLSTEYVPRFKEVLIGIGEGIKATKCKDDPKWVEAAKAWALATGYQPK